MSTNRNAKHRKLIPWLLALLVLISGSTVTLMSFQQSREQEASAMATLFHAETARLTANISHRLDTYAVVMRGVQGFFLGSDDVSYEEFVKYAATLDISASLAGVQGLAYVAAVPRAQQDDHLRAYGPQLPVVYRIHPASDRPLLAPIVFIAPLSDGNRSAVGFDIYSNPLASEAAKLARDSGAAAITAPLTLIQDVGRETPAFVMYLPIYRQPAVPPTVAERRQLLQGWVDIPIRMADFMATVREEVNPHLDVEIRDADLDESANLLFHSDTTPHQLRGEMGELQTISQIAIGGRTWTLLVSNTPEFREQVSLAPRATMVGISGGSLTFALAVLVFFIARNWDASERRAARMSHLYQALSEINQAIIRMENEADLFPLVCRMAVDCGDMEHAWVGQLDQEANSLSLAARYGVGSEELNNDGPLDIRADTPQGQTALAIAGRTGEPVVINDYMNDSRTQFWQQRARHFGWRSSGYFPIYRHGKPFALLNIYHSKKNAFDDDTIGLMTEMTKDIGFALDNFDREDQRQRFASALSESETRLSTILENVGACIYLKDVDGRYTFVNRQLPELWGAAGPDAVIGCRDEDFYTSATVASVRQNDRRVIEHGEIIEDEELYTLKANGTTHIFWSVKLPLRSADGTIYALCGISTDISDRKASEEQIRYLSNYDSLTGLPNRTLLSERTRIALADAKADNTGAALLCIDLDRFKIINESLGHSVGDLILRLLSQRLTAELHLDATLCRMGGDEFFLLLPGVDAEQAAAVARQLLATLNRPLDVANRSLTLTGSIGVALFPDHGRDFEQLTQSADAALAEAKTQGRNTYQFFSQSLRAQADETLQVENELRQALIEDQLVLHYQPQLDMATGAITGVEALVRWQHPQRGMIPPGKFIPVAEESGLIIDIGNWVLDRAAAQLAAWNAQGLSPLSVAVNLSVVQLYKDNFYDIVAGVMETYGLAPGMLELEITERIAMEHSSHTIATLGQLHRMGVTLSIDDFGTGFSSLNYLKRYPVHKLKIDKSFVDGVGEDSEDQAIVTAIIGVARGLRFKTIAEGVETREQWEFLKANGCNAYQGYYFSRPLPAAEITQLLVERQQS